jgi:hypothetical protein
MKDRQFIQSLIDQLHFNQSISFGTEEDLLTVTHMRVSAYESAFFFTLNGQAHDKYKTALGAGLGCNGFLEKGFRLELEPEEAVMALRMALERHDSELVLELLNPDRRESLPDWEEAPDYIFDDWQGYESKALKFLERFQ